MTVGMEAVLAAYLADEGVQFGVLELDDRAASLAVKVLVLRIAVVMFIVHARPQFQATQQAGIDELRKSPINSCPADRQPRLLHIVDQLFGVEMVMLAENEANH